MPTVTPIMVGAGLRRIFIGKLDTSGYLVGGIASAAAGSVSHAYRMYGALTLPVQLSTPQRKAILGDDDVTATFQFAPTELPQGDLTTSVDDIDLQAFLQGTIVTQYGAEIDLGILVPDSISPADIILLSHQESKAVPAGTKKWRTQILMNTQLFARGSEMKHQEGNTVTYSYALSKGTRLPWGEVLVAGTQGTTQAGILNLNAPQPIMLTAALGNAVATVFAVAFTPAAATADAVRVWVNGVAKTITTDFTVDTSAKTVTFAVAPAVAAKIVIMYQFLDTEL